MNEEIQINAVKKRNYLIDLMNQCVCKCSKHLQTHNLYLFDLVTKLIEQIKCVDYFL